MAIMDRPLRLVVPRSLYETLSEQAKDQDRTVSWIVRQALRNHLGGSESKPRERVSAPS